METSSIIIVTICAITVLATTAGYYYYSRYRYLTQARLFAQRHSLAIREVTEAGRDVALSGRIDGRMIKTSIARMSVDEAATQGVTPDVVGYYFEAYHIEVDIDDSQQWLVVMNFEHQGRERLQTPVFPRYQGRYSTASRDFDKSYFLFADSRPSHRLFGNPALLAELAVNRLRAAHADAGTLHLYFERPMVWKYPSFGIIESLIRLAMHVAS